MYTAIVGVILALAGLARPARAQSDSTKADTTQRGPAPLTLQDAIAIAHRNNPDYLTTLASRRVAKATTRAANGAFIPSLTATLTGQYQEGGTTVFNGAALGANSSVYNSSYNLAVSYLVNKALFVNPRLEKANAQATEYDIRSANTTLSANVEQLYLQVLQSQETVLLQDTLIASTQAQLDLARGRAKVGSGTQLDVQRAEVALSQQQVGKLRAVNQLSIDRLRLFQTMGVTEPSAGAYLATAFPVLPAVPPLDNLLALAQRQNPSVLALRSRQKAAELGVSRATGEYWPTLTITTGIGGQTYQYKDPDFLVNQARSQTLQSRVSCIRSEEVRAALGLPNMLAACSSIAFTDAEAAAIRRQNSQFPFDFKSTPRSITAQISLPLFDGFAREQRIEVARVQREDARYNTRSKELALTADVTAAYNTLETARRTLALQQENSAKARLELKYTQDQYTVGLATFVDLTTSRSSFAQAETDRINAEYDYHKAFAALENAVGRSLR